MDEPEGERVAEGRTHTATGGRTPSVGATVPCTNEIAAVERRPPALRAQYPPVVPADAGLRAGRPDAGPAVLDLRLPREVSGGLARH